MKAGRKRKPITGESPSLLVRLLQTAYVDADEPEIVALAERAGVHRATLLRHLQGKRKCEQLMTVERALAALGYTVRLVPLSQKESRLFRAINTRTQAPSNPS